MFPSMKMKEHGIWAVWDFSIKTGCQKFVFEFPGTQYPAVSTAWCLFLNKHEYSEPDD